MKGKQKSPVKSNSLTKGGPKKPVPKFMSKLPELKAGESFRVEKCEGGKIVTHECGMKNGKYQEPKKYIIPD